VRLVCAAVAGSGGNSVPHTVLCCSATSTVSCKHAPMDALRVSARATKSSCSTALLPTCAQGKLLCGLQTEPFGKMGVHLPSHLHLPHLSRSQAQVALGRSFLCWARLNQARAALGNQRLWSGTAGSHAAHAHTRGAARSGLAAISTPHPPSVRLQDLLVAFISCSSSTLL